MKRVFLAAMAVGCALFCMCAVAQAYTCATAPSSYTGNLTISESGSCTITHGVSATGSINIEASGSTQIEGGVSAGGYVSLNATSGTLKVEGTISAPSHFVVLQSEGNMSLQNISTEGSGGSEVRVFANDGHSGSTPFEVGSAGATNGIGHIYANSTGSSSDGIYITNGGSGGISYSGENLLQVSSASGKAGFIDLDSRSAVGATGPVTLSGKLSVNGTGENLSGSITIMAPEIKVSGETTLSSYQKPGAGTTHFGHFINFATEKVKLESNLNLYLPGNAEGPAWDDTGISPVGSIAVTVPTGPEETIGLLSYPNSSEPLTTEGAGKLSIFAEGKNSAVAIWGNPLKLGKTYIDASGSGDEVFIASETGSSSPVLNKLTFGGAVEVNVQAEETGATPGEIYVAGSEIAKPEGNVYLDTAGVKGGNGGTVRVLSEKGEDYLGGSGDNITLNVSAFDGDGSAGTAKVEAGKSTVKIAENAFYASSFEGDSDGGTIETFGGKIESTKANVALVATGYGSGKGGKLYLDSEGELSIGGSTGELEVETAYTNTGGGGSVELSASDLNLNGGYVFITPFSSGNGGEIKVTNTGALKISNEYALEADGAGDGSGGIISFDADSIEFTGPYSAVVTANGAGTEDGGKITFEIAGGTPMTLEPEHITEISAKGGVDAIGGSITMSNVVGAPGEPIIVNELFRIESGSGSSSNADGSLTLGTRTTTVTCFQYKTGYAIWPKTYWNCIPPYGEEPKLAEAADTLRSELREMLAKDEITPNNPTVSIFAMPLLKSYETFFETTVGTPELQGASMVGARVSAAFANLLNKKGEEESIPVAEKDASIIHELGHQLQFMWAESANGPGGAGVPQLGAENEFFVLISKDLEYMNYTKTTPPKVLRSCEEVFLKTTCEKYFLTYNSEIFQEHFEFFHVGEYTVKGLNEDSEVFCEMFETIVAGEAGHPYHGNEELEKALKFLPEAYAYVKEQIESPRAAKH